MMNIVALGLVFSSLLAAEVWSPSPVLQRENEDVIVKKGHRVVVVEYDQNRKPNTKVSISPSRWVGGDEEVERKGIFRAGVEKMKETASDDRDAGKAVEESQTGKGPGELICNALGECTRRVAGAMSRAKDKVARVVHDAEDKSEELVREATEAAQEAEDAVVEKAHDAKESVAKKARELKDRAGQKAGEAKEKACRTVGEAKEKAAQKAGEATDKVSLKADEMKETAAKKSSEAKEKMTQKAEEMKGKAAEKAEDLKDMAIRRARSASYRAHRLVKQLGSALVATIYHASVGEVVSLVGLATAYGTCVWVTFVSSYVLAAVLPRHQFGLVQSKLYPVYFRAMGWSIVGVLIGHAISRGKLVAVSKAEILQGLNLLAAISMVVWNAVVLEPRATKAMFERMKVEKEEGRGRESEGMGGSRTSAAESQRKTPINDQDMGRRRMLKLSGNLKRLNSYSSWLNILTLMSLTWHVVYLGQRLHRSC